MRLNDRLLLATCGGAALIVMVLSMALIAMFIVRTETRNPLQFSSTANHPSFRTTGAIAA